MQAHTCESSAEGWREEEQEQILRSSCLAESSFPTEPLSQTLTIQHFLLCMFRNFVCRATAAPENTD